MSWTNFDKDTNENIEKAFCDPSKLQSVRSDSPLRICFIHSISKIHFTNDSSTILYRRLSTLSSVEDDTNAKQGVTHWRWYWEKSKDVWEEYKLWVGLFLCMFSSLGMQQVWSIN